MKLCLMFFCATTMACDYYLNSDEINYHGYIISYGTQIEDKLDDLGYHRVHDSAVSNQLKVIADEEKRGRFNFAIASVQFERVQTGPVTVNRSKRCWTTHCSVFNIRKNLNKTLNRFLSKMPRCD